VKDWFDSLETRERWFVSVGGVVVVIALVYGLAWAPLEKKHATLTADVDSWQRSLAELRPLRVTASGNGQNRPAPVIGAQQSPIIIVDQTLRSRGLDRYRQRSQPTANNGIRVEFENVAFDELVLWLGDLSDQYGMHVQAGSFGKTTQVGPGRINATLTLERAL
jgi:general secretion pathway protein M